MRPGLVLPAFLVALAGCAGAAPASPASADPPAPPASQASAQDAAEAEELEALYWSRQRAAQTRFTDADVAFMTGMIGHHAQALVMAAMAPTHGASPSVRTLAARIDNAQRDEIETMQRWLRDRGQPVPEVEVEGTTLTIRMTGGDEPGSERGAGQMDHGAMDHGQTSDDVMDHGAMDHGAMGHGPVSHDHMGMPGMLTQAQLDQLDAARGPAFDRLFLTYMIQHHGGAVVMVDDLFAADGAGQDEASFKLASDVQVDQRTEIARMERMLGALSDS